MCKDWENMPIENEPSNAESSPSAKSDNSFVNPVTNIEPDFIVGIADKTVIDKISEITSKREFPFFGKKKGVIGENASYDEIIDFLSSLGKIYEANIGYFTVVHDEYIMNFTINRKGSLICYKAKFLTCSPNKKREVAEELKRIETKQSYSVCPIKLYTTNWQGRVMDVNVDESISETVHGEAYPFLRNGNIDGYIEDFLNSDENVLIFLGDVGTGKTKLVRHLLRYATERSTNSLSSNSDEIFNSSNFNVFYTTTHKALETDELFHDFISQPAILVLEDIDFHLKGREEDNPLMYKLLAFSDGLITSHNKIVISTNAKPENIDSALVRPGRCFSLSHFRKLTLNEANKLLERLGSNEFLDYKRNYSLSEVYRFYNTGKLSNEKENIGDNASKKVGF